jgi:hypothetical protein
MAIVRFLNQGPRRSIPNSSNDDFFWDVVTVIGSAALGAVLAVTTRALLARTTWSVSSQNVALGTTGLLLGSAAMAAGRDGVGIGIATASMALASASWREETLPALIPAGAPEVAIYDAAWRSPAKLYGSRS